MVKQQDRSDTTKARLLSAFRASVLALGYKATTTQHVLDKTGLSKGAMYHHFRSKAEMMHALYEAESRGAFQRALAGTGQETSPKAQLKGLCMAWMQEIKAPKVAKLLFEIGPSALGPARAKDIEDEISLRHIEGLLADAIAAGEIENSNAKLAAALLNALVGEAALYRLRTGEETARVLDTMLEKILGPARN